MNVNNSAPFEIIAAPFTVWAAVVGTTFPDVDTDPSASWVKLGTNGDKNYDEDGVKIKASQKLNFLRTLGSTGPAKAFRIEEDIVVSFDLLDMTLEMIKHAFNGNTVTDTAAVSGTPGYRSMPLLRGLDVTQRALLVRGPSSYAASMNMDLRLPRVVNEGEPEIIGAKGKAMALALAWRAVEDPDYAWTWARDQG